MTPRADFLGVLLRNRLRMDAERREFARRVMGVVARNSAGRERFDVTAYALTMRDLEPLFNEFYGRWPADTDARFWRLIVAECRAARVLAFRRARTDVIGRLQRHPAILRAIRTETA